MRADTFRFASPLGDISYGWDGEVCREVNLRHAAIDAPAGSDPVRAWLVAYFAGKACPLPPLAAPRTPFQAAMREVLLAIPAGETRTYGEVAASMGTAPRAVGQALGANPLPLLIPCHRVLAAHGIGGFSCGLEWKRRLLGFEAGGAE